jgi:hypothetical protein
VVIVAFLSVFIHSSLGCQKIIRGKLVDGNLDPLIGAHVFGLDGENLGVTDINGEYEVDIPYDVDNLVYAYTGYENTIIGLKRGCSRADVILQDYWVFHYRSTSRIERKRRAQFNRINSVYDQAFEQGLFPDKFPCYEYIYRSKKKEFDEIKKEMKIEWRDQKLLFRKLNTGDIVEIPFSGSKNHDGTGRTTMFFYSVSGRHSKDDCIVECEILSKNKRELFLRIVSLDSCLAREPILDGTEVKIGREFSVSLPFRVLQKY